MSRFRYVLITKAESDSLWAYYPPCIKSSIVNQTKSLCHSFKSNHNGQIETKNENYFYSTYSIDNSRDRFFLFLVCDNSVKDSEANNFFDSLYEHFRNENVNPKDSGNSLNSDVKSLLSQTFEIYTKGEWKKNTDIIEVKKNQNENVVIEMEDVSTKKKSDKSSLDESTVKNRLIGNEDDENESAREEGNEVENLESNNVFVKDAAQLQKVTWWRRMKMIFIVICLILAIGLYVSIPFLMKYKNNFTSSEQES